jgi:hypothetical protein
LSPNLPGLSYFMSRTEVTFSSNILYIYIEAISVMVVRTKSVNTDCMQTESLFAYLVTKLLVFHYIGVYVGN